MKLILFLSILLFLPIKFFHIPFSHHPVRSETQQQIEALDILFNEILPDPRMDGAEFIEIYNQSDKTIDLQELEIARINDKGQYIGRAHLSNTVLPMFPHTYKVLSTDPEQVKQQYRTGSADAFFTPVHMPVLPNEGGTIVLISNNTIIDRLDYTADMHSPFIKDPKGVSLERRRFDQPTNAPGNFTSAAAATNYATPGYQNSMYEENQQDDNKTFWLNSRTCSPDNDGFEDLLVLNYRINGDDYMANMVIYNDRGTPVKHLVQNYRLASSGQLEWNGLNDDGQLAQVGIHILWIEIYNSKGELKHERKSFVLAKKL